MSTTLHAAWRAAIAPLSTSAAVVVNRGWDLSWERDRWGESALAGRAHLSVRLYEDEVLVGPLWVPGTDSGCPGCAEIRGRTVVDHPLAGDLSQPCGAPAASGPLLPEIVHAVSHHLAHRPLRPGELYAAGSRTCQRHRVPRSVRCPVCGTSPAGETRQADPLHPPHPLGLHSRPAAGDDPTRGAASAHLMARNTLRERLVDVRFGPVRGTLRESRAPFAMSMANLPDAPAMGHGRALTFTATEPVAILEAYERLGGFPFDSPVLTDVAYADIAGRALDPASLGQHTQTQLAHPTCRVRPCTPTTPMDWVCGHDLATGTPVLVPAEVGFYQYDHRYKLDRRAARAASDREHYFLESSSGCAAGAGLEEAVLHSLLELAERDAFLLSWHQAVPLPHIPLSSLTDPTSQGMIELVHARGFEVHILVATQDITVPVVWALAVNHRSTFPATFSSAGSGADPVAAVRGALREVAQLVSIPTSWEQADVEPMLADVWQVRELEDHVRFSTHPDAARRATAALGGPRTTLREAFPGWPETLDRGDVLAAVRHVSGLFADAGLQRIVIVNQTTREHRDAGIAVAKAVVPGIVPMCFGHAQQRLANLPRLRAALHGTPQADRAIPYDPHPFP